MADSILVVEDDLSLQEILTSALRARGYIAEVAGDGRSALDQASIMEPDLIILDLGLPDIDGVEVCRRLRRWLHSPILVLSADGDNERKVAALDEGADDYVTKPFLMAELLARIRVGLRHRAAVATVMADTRVITVGDLVIDAAAHMTWAGDELIDLSPKEFAILKCLALQPGRVITHRALIQIAGGRSKEATSGALRIHIMNLRNKLGAGRSRPSIVSKPGVGYRLLVGGDQD